MTPDLTSVISSSDLLKYLILIKTIDTHLLHLLLSGRTFYSDEVTRPFLKKGTCLIPPIQRKETVLPYTALHPKIMQAQGALNTYPGENKRALTTSVIRAHIKKGSYLLSRIALQYHRRNRA